MTDIAVYAYDTEDLINKISAFCNEPNKVKLVKILNRFGWFSAGIYYILDQELYEYNNDAWNVAEILDRIYGTDGIFENVFIGFNRRKVSKMSDYDLVLDDLRAEGVI